MLPLVSVLILTYDRTDLLDTCLSTALKSDYPRLEFIVSDNGSKEDIKAFVKKNFKDKRIRTYRLDKNKGLTGGFNFGFQFCRGKYVMLLSNDTTIKKNAISEMVKMMIHDRKLGIVAPKIIQMKNSKLLHNVGSFFTNSGLLYHYGISKLKDNPLYQKSYYIFSANGAGFLIRKDVTKITELFDQDFFVYYDESDLCHRVWLAGYTIVYCPKAEISHLWGATIKNENPYIWFLNHRNKIISFYKNLSLWHVLLVESSFLFILLFWMSYKLIKGQFRLAYSVPQAYFWIFTHQKQIRRKRKHVQYKIRKVPDNEIFQKCKVAPPLIYYPLLYLQGYQDSKLPERVMY